ncbi:hypothetical protein ADUPG1_008609 [Aduncisulcus paluster]|uniref:Uncharacterized protein n=1 Tax=Aduncisulcus paluster TaxID=2918883 RepID=A0ABQ5KTY1_9EUKA|nr:hypothetical protein ADUPG1_008609 [Aduncisulcus paluster]
MNNFDELVISLYSDNLKAYSAFHEQLFHSPTLDLRKIAFSEKNVSENLIPILLTPHFAKNISRVLIPESLDDKNACFPACSGFDYNGRRLCPFPSPLYAPPLCDIIEIVILLCQRRYQSIRDKDETIFEFTSSNKAFGIPIHGYSVLDLPSDDSLLSHPLLTFIEYLRCVKSALIVYSVQKDKVFVRRADIMSIPKSKKDKKKTRGKGQKSGVKQSRKKQFDTGEKEDHEKELKKEPVKRSCHLMISDPNQYNPREILTDNLNIYCGDDDKLLRCPIYLCLFHFAGLCVGEASCKSFIGFSHSSCSNNIYYKYGVKTNHFFIDVSPLIDPHIYEAIYSILIWTKSISYFNFLDVASNEAIRRKSINLQRLKLSTSVKDVQRIDSLISRKKGYISFPIKDFQASLPFDIARKIGSFTSYSNVMTPSQLLDLWLTYDSAFIPAFKTLLEEAKEKEKEEAKEEEKEKGDEDKLMTSSSTSTIAKLERMVRSQHHRVKMPGVSWMSEHGYEVCNIIKTLDYLHGLYSSVEDRFDCWLNDVYTARDLKASDFRMFDPCAMYPSFFNEDLCTEFVNNLYPYKDEIDDGFSQTVATSGWSAITDLSWIPCYMNCQLLFPILMPFVAKEGSFFPIVLGRIDQIRSLSLHEHIVGSALMWEKKITSLCFDPIVPSHLYIESEKDEGEKEIEGEREDIEVKTQNNMNVFSNERLLRYEWFLSELFGRSVTSLKELTLCGFHVRCVSLDDDSILHAGVGKESNFRRFEKEAIRKVEFMRQCGSLESIISHNIVFESIPKDFFGKESTGSMKDSGDISSFSVVQFFCALFSHPGFKWIRLGDWTFKAGSLSHLPNASVEKIRDSIKNCSELSEFVFEPFFSSIACSFDDIEDFKVFCYILTALSECSSLKEVCFPSVSIKGFKKDTDVSASSDDSASNISLQVDTGLSIFISSLPSSVEILQLDSLPLGLTSLESLVKFVSRPDVSIRDLSLGKCLDVISDPTTDSGFSCFISLLDALAHSIKTLYLYDINGIIQSCLTKFDLKYRELLIQAFVKMTHLETLSCRDVIEGRKNDEENMFLKIIIEAMSRDAFKFCHGLAFSTSNLIPVTKKDLMTLIGAFISLVERFPHIERWISLPKTKEMAEIKREIPEEYRSLFQFSY